MTTYPQNIIVLDKKILNNNMEGKSTAEQALYEFQIPANTLSNTSKLRLLVNLSRVVADTCECNTDTPLAIEVLGSPLSCATANYTTTLKGTGGSPPYTWETSQCKLVDNGNCTATLSIHTDVPLNELSFQGYAGDIENPPLDNPVTCDSLLAIAYVRFGEERNDKGIFSVCRHTCNYLSYNCHDEPDFGDATLREGDFIIDGLGCPDVETSASGVWGTPGKVLGPCTDMSKCGIPEFPPIYYLGSVGDRVECSAGTPDGPLTGGTLQAAYEAASPLCDVRHPNLITGGCCPCSLLQGQDIIVTLTDANGDSVATTVPVG